MFSWQKVSWEVKGKKKKGMNILRSKLSHGGERRVRVRIKPSSSGSVGSNRWLAERGVFQSTWVGRHLLKLSSVYIPPPPCLVCGVHHQLIGAIIWRRENTNMATGGRFLDIVGTSAVAAVLFPEHFLGCAELSARVSCVTVAYSVQWFNIHSKPT